MVTARSTIGEESTELYARPPTASLAVHVARRRETGAFTGDSSDRTTNLTLEIPAGTVTGSALSILAAIAAAKRTSRQVGLVLVRGTDTVLAITLFFGVADTATRSTHDS